MRLATRKLLFFSLFILSPSFVFAEIATQQTGSQVSQHELQKRNENLRRNLEANKPIEIKSQVSSNQPAEQGAVKVFVSTIVVNGNTILSPQEINKIIAPFENRKLTIADMQQAANRLTEVYRKKGYITTKVILSPQRLTVHTLELTVIEGETGKITVVGNKYYRKSAYLRRIELKDGQPFNYYTLRDNLADINQYSDHYAKAVLVPGQEPETTDVLIEVKDRLPVHLDLSYDNFASRYIGKNEYTATLRDNNLLGFDDTLALSYEGSNNYAYMLGAVSYLVPVTNRTQIGLAASKNRVVLQKDLKAFNAQGKSKLYSAFINQTLVEGENLKITANAGFDYKDVFNFELNNEVSRDRLRIVKSGFNVYYNDVFAGRNIFADEFFQGIPDIMAGSRAKDPQSSVVGAGGEFSKDVVDFLRLQQLPWETSLLFKSEAQFSSDVLPAIEEYQLGGIANNRGFGPLEAVGDTGQSLSTELNVPLYFIPTSVKVPFSTVSLYDATRFVAFYDWGHVNLRNPQAGEPKNRSLGSAGCGVRFDLPENFSLRVEIGWPVQGVPTSDHRHAHLWLQVIKEF